MYKVMLDLEASVEARILGLQMLQKQINAKVSKLQREVDSITESACDGVRRSLPERAVFKAPYNLRTRLSSLNRYEYEDCKTKENELQAD